MLWSLLRLSCRKMGAQSEIGQMLRRNGLILRRNGFPVIINDDFLEEGGGGGGGVTADNAYLTHS